MPQVSTPERIQSNESTPSSTSRANNARPAQGDHSAHGEAGHKVAQGLQFFVKTATRQHGPFSAGQLQRLASTGQLQPHHVVSTDRERWVRAAEVKGLLFPPTTIATMPCIPPSHAGESRGSRDVGTPETAASAIVPAIPPPRTVLSRPAPDPLQEFLNKLAPNVTPNNRQGDEPFLPVKIAGRHTTFLRRHRCEVHVDRQALVVKRRDGSVMAEVPQSEAPQRLRVGSFHMKISTSDGSTIQVRFKYDKQLGVAVGRMRAWAQKLSGDAARKLIFNHIARCELRVPIALVCFQLIMGILLYLLALQHQDARLMAASAVGVAFLVPSLVGMLLRQTWAPLTAGILNVLAIGDTALAVFTLPPGYQLTAIGVVVLLGRMVVLGAFVAAYFRGYGQLCSAVRYRRMTALAQPHVPPADSKIQSRSGQARRALPRHLRFLAISTSAVVVLTALGGIWWTVTKASASPRFTARTPNTTSSAKSNATTTERSGNDTVGADSLSRKAVDRSPQEPEPEAPKPEAPKPEPSRLPPPFILVPGSRVFDAGHVEMQAWTTLEIGPGTRILELKHLKYRLWSESKSFTIRAQGNVPLRLQCIEKGSLLQGNFSQEFYWVSQPYEILDDAMNLVYSDPFRRQTQRQSGGVLSNIPAPSGPSPVIPQSPAHAAPTDNAPVTPSLPADFAFLGLTKVTAPTDLNDVLRGGVWLSFEGGGDELLLSTKRDAVRGLHGKGLRIQQRNKGNILNGTFQLHFIWTPEPLACYRDRQLLGIWDPEVRKLRVANADETPTILPEEKGKNSKDNRRTADREDGNNNPVDDWHVWTSGDRQHTTQAKFLKFQDGKVHLEKRDGSVIQVSMNALSKADQQLVRDILRQRRSGPQVARRGP